jgi:hypothetical protein
VAAGVRARDLASIDSLESVATSSSSGSNATRRTGRCCRTLRHVALRKAAMAERAFEEGCFEPFHDGYQCLGTRLQAGYTVRVVSYK